MRIVFAVVCCLVSLVAVARAEEDGVSESTSTAAAAPRTVDDIYTGAKYRDPFVQVMVRTSGVSAAAAAEWDPEDFSIHELALKGIMRDKSGAFAILTDRVSGVGFILRKGKLYDFKNNQFEGVTGKINVAQKTIYLITAEKDVQTLRLGEDDEEDYGEDAPSTPVQPAVRQVQSVARQVQQAAAPAQKSAPQGQSGAGGPPL